MQALRSLYHLRVSLDYIEPAIWRSVVVPSSIELSTLHSVLQVVMGWKNCHLHQFVVGKIRYGTVDPQFNDGTTDQTGVRLAALLKTLGTTIHYEYDFGDGWMHRIELEATTEWTPATNVAHCVAGERSCPPEDVGGPPGYEEFLLGWNDATHQEHKTMRKWAGRSFAPEKFDVAAVNKKLAKIRL